MTKYEAQQTGRRAVLNRLRTLLGRPAPTIAPGNSETRKLPRIDDILAKIGREPFETP
jgi:hypothetical protein